MATARSMWKATLVLGRRTLPVDLFGAISDRELHLHLLHGKSRERVQQRMVDPTDGRTVPPEETRRGVEVERGRYVLLDAQEIASVEPEPSRDIVLTAFVPRGAIDHRWYERPYYLGPGRGHGEDYAALVQALDDSGRDGFARWTMRKREYAGVLHPYRGALVLIALRHAGEVVTASSLEAPEGRALDARELQLATQLVGALSGPFEHEAFRDEYRDRVLELVKRKQKGGRIPSKRWKAKPVDDDSLVAALRQSLKTAG